MKLVTVSLIALLAILQYKFWQEADGIQDWLRLKQAITLQTAENLQLSLRNNQLAAEIEDLKHGEDAIQEHARNDLGMISQGEVFYQILDK
jgi:cell division protein FtsB